MKWGIRNVFKIPFNGGRITKIPSQGLLRSRANSFTFLQLQYHPSAFFLKQDSTKAHHEMKLRHVVLNFKVPRPEKESLAAYQSEFRSRLKANPQLWTDYQERQKVFMKRYLHTLSDEQKRARREIKVQRQKKRW
ncbi:hypothetical protein PoB_006747000 [Plakobranchus ocellatus]|uniref:Uncharacterized protein n=1 Tax=Plakobranchus ocellatus TaxID=259542 RepID=A0AAV4DAJ3_9GAST|nr:hypothetical protein PoB_006747000 [Plakobranchus ocellatus]